LKAVESVSSLSRVAAHAHARGIHHRQQHIFSALVIFRVLVTAETAIVALAAHVCGRLAAHIARPYGRFIPGGHHRLYGSSFSEAREADGDFRACTEVIHMVDTIAGPGEYLAHPAVHTNLLASRGVKLAQMVAAF